MQNSNSPWDLLNSWPVIVGCFVLGLWPIGLLLIFFGDRIAAEGKRHAEERPRTEESKTAAALRQFMPRQKERSEEEQQKKKLNRQRARSIVGAVLTTAGFLTISEPIGFLIDGFSASVWLEDLWLSLSLIAAGCALIGTRIAAARREKSYVTYLAAMGDRDSISITEFAKTVGISHVRALRELRRMTEEGMFYTGAYLDVSRDRLYRCGSAAAWDLQREAEAAQTQAKPAERDEYDLILQNIRRANDEIADEELSRKIDRIEAVTRKIFAEVERHPEKKAQINMLLNYYLPTTQKLLDSYARFEATGAEGENLRQAKQRIEGTMDRIVTAFEKQLDTLYSSDAMDVESDIRVMEQMLHRDSADAEKDFGLKL